MFYAMQLMLVCTLGLLLTSSKLPSHTGNDRPTLFYLDAHWENHLPLKDELQIIFEHAQQFLILIDDFCVPHDAGYGYDNYGDGKSLELAYLRPLSQYRFAVFFPTAPSVLETGYRRGCVVLARGDPIIDQLSTWSSLRRDDSLWTTPMTPRSAHIPD